MLALQGSSLEGDKVASLNGYDPLELHKGDMLDFSFQMDTTLEDGLSRAYILKAVGRYQPDYSVFTELLPTQTMMHSNYPNPFNPTTTFSFDIAVETKVELSVYDVRGRLVKKLIPGDTFGAGAHTVVWDGKNTSGARAASGVYFYRFEAGAYHDTGRVTMVK